MAGIYVIIAAAGTGRRCGGFIPKQFRVIGGEAVVKLAVQPFLQFSCISGLVCVIPDSFREVYDGIFREYSDRRILPPICGGLSRFDSVRRGLNHLAEHAPEYVLIHDAARAFCPSSMIERILEAVRPEARAVVPVIKSADSVRVAGKAVDRSHVDLVQTPQAFDFKLIHGLYNRFEESQEFSDDSALCDAAGIPITMVDGDRENRKITFQEDFKITGIRTGFGFDAHRFSTDTSRKLYLMGICIDKHTGLEGYSDADVGIHSIVDAILGAMGSGSIGNHFPSSSDKWKAANSKLFLLHCRDLLKQSNSVINNIDVTIVCEFPRIDDYVDSMKREVSKYLEIREDAINIKGKTTEGMGFTGRQEGIAVYSVVIITYRE
ncbi:MAG: 2-C-methyl-D-erythritol 2,4-cyclodiphosphate synthase [Holosporales bacterium]|nr:2-C-methyl-D-erythritol 2,4-cyclodiphosphate synthase [Holosporales bacterium]